MRRALYLLPILLCVRCATTDSTPAVSDSDLGRLQPNQLAPINQAQEAMSAAEQDHSRRAHDLEMAQQRLEETLPKEEVASAHVDVATAQAKGAASSGDPNLIAQASSQMSSATAELARSRAEIAYRRAIVMACQKAVDDADAKLQVHQAQLLRARLTALQDAGNPAANKYPAAAFDTQVAERSGDEAKAKAALVEAEQAAAAARSRWEQLGGVDDSGAEPPSARR